MPEQNTPDPRQGATQTRAYTVTVDVRCSVIIEVDAAASKSDAIRIAQEQYDAGWYDVDEPTDVDWDTASARAGS